MAGITLAERVSTLERQVSDLATRDDVKALGEQILHLGTEMRAGFSAIREEIRAGDEETRRVLREEIRAGDEETRRLLGEQILAGDEESRNFMRILYEDVIDRLGKLRG
jgi:U3 small nucleolar RNA-associated protein 14